jgi:hypothetical protein
LLGGLIEEVIGQMESVTSSLRVGPSGRQSSRPLPSPSESLKHEEQLRAAALMQQFVARLWRRLLQSPLHQRRTVHRPAHKLPRKPLKLLWHQYSRHRQGRTLCSLVASAVESEYRKEVASMMYGGKPPNAALQRTWQHVTPLARARVAPHCPAAELGC